MNKHTKLPWVNGWGQGITGPTTPTQKPTCHESVIYNDWQNAGSDYNNYPKIMHTVISKDMETIAIIPLCGPNGEANAKFIVRAVNAHEKLLATSEAMLEALVNCPGEFNYPVLIEIELRAAIAIAKN